MHPMFRLAAAPLNRCEHSGVAALPTGSIATQDAGMRPAPFPSLLLLALAMTAPVIVGTTPARADDGVTIYRCTDSQGRLTLRDSPCSPGERQEARSMVRPKDAPPRPQAPTPAPTTSAAMPAPQIILVNAPRPLYECVTPDNMRYLSDTPEGNPRIVPAWTQGYPVLARVPVYQPGLVDLSIDYGNVSGSYSSGGYIGSEVVPTAAGQGSGTWIRDACHALPQNEVCSRLRDRRAELRRRYSIAQPSERAVLGREESSLQARLSQDCR